MNKKGSAPTSGGRTRLNRQKEKREETRPYHETERHTRNWNCKDPLMSGTKTRSRES